MQQRAELIEMLSGRQTMCAKRTSCKMGSRFFHTEALSREGCVWSIVKYTDYAAPTLTTFEAYAYVAATFLNVRLTWVVL